MRRALVLLPLLLAGCLAAPPPSPDAPAGPADVLAPTEAPPVEPPAPPEAAGVPLLPDADPSEPGATDLVALGASVSPQRIYPKVPVTPRLAARNEGGVLTHNVTIEGSIDGVPVCRVHTYAQAEPTTSSISCPEWRATTIGTHTLRFVIDPNGTVKDTARANNVVTLTFEVLDPDLPDVSIVRVDQQRYGFRFAENVTLTPVVKNWGGGTTDARLFVDYYVDGVLVQRSPVPPLAWSAMASVPPLVWAFPDGRHTVRVVLDAQGAVPETHKDNNAWEESFWTNEASTPLLTVRAERASYAPGQPVTLLAENPRGEAATGPVVLTVHDVFGELVWTSPAALDALPARGAHAATWSGRLADGNAAPAGTYVARLSVGDEAARAVFTLGTA